MDMHIWYKLHTTSENTPYLRIYIESPLHFQTMYIACKWHVHPYGDVEFYIIQLFF